MMTSQKRIKDFHKNKHDVDALNERALAKLDRFTRFEKMFPFYRMDVNGFVFKLKEALNLELPKHEKARHIFEIKSISRESLAQAFSTHPSWKDLEDEKSEFVSFLNDSCGVKDKLNHFNVERLRTIGLLWCDGDVEEKVLEIYDVLQENGNEKIASNDKDFKKYYYEIIYLSTEMVFQLQPKYVKDGKSDMFNIQIDEDLREEKTDEFMEEFLDTIFEYEGVLERDDWIENVVDKQSYIVNPKKIREKMGIAVQ